MAQLQAACTVMHFRCGQNSLVLGLTRLWWRRRFSVLLDGRYTQRSVCQMNVEVCSSSSWCRRAWYVAGLLSDRQLVLRPRSTFGLSPTIRSVAAGNQWNGPMKSVLKWFHWSAPLASCSD